MIVSAKIISVHNSISEQRMRHKYRKYLLVTSNIGANEIEGFFIRIIDKKNFNYNRLMLI